MHISYIRVLLYTLYLHLVSCNPGPLPSNRHGKKCPPFSGNFTISAAQLYPENADFGFNTCELYIGAVWNASVGIYDPYTKDIDVVEFEGITHNPDLHIGGVAINPRTNLLSILVNYWPTFVTGDLSGPVYLMLMDPSSRKVLYKINLTTTTKGQFGGFQDLEFDLNNNVYVVGGVKSSILKVDSKGKRIETWYVNLTQTTSPDEGSGDVVIPGFGGLAAKGWTLIASDGGSGNLYRFNMRAAQGIPRRIAVKPAYRLESPDAIQLPPRYKGTVLLVAEVRKGVSVFRDRKGEWKEAEYLGTVEWVDPDIIPGLVTAPVQIGDGIYMSFLNFGDAPAAGGPGSQTEFPFIDITARVDALLRG